MEMISKDPDLLCDLGNSVSHLLAPVSATVKGELGMIVDHDSRSWSDEVISRRISQLKKITVLSHQG